jgi:hypothetical protein
MRGLDRHPPAADQAALTQPGEQRRDVRHRINRLASFLFERVPEGDEELLGLVVLGKRSTIERHVTIVQPLTSYFDLGTFRM